MMVCRLGSHLHTGSAGKQHVEVDGGADLEIMLFPLLNGIVVP